MNLEIALGIDPHITNMPPFMQEVGLKGLESFVLILLKEFASSEISWVKFQSAYFEEHGIEGLKIASNMIKQAKSLGYEVIYDGKRGDIGTSAAAYARAYLETGKDFEVDALTMHAYHGFDSLNTCFELAKSQGKRIFVLVRTSNLGAEDVQESAAPKLLQRIEAYNADRIQNDGFGPIGAVVGATQTEFAQQYRNTCPHTMWLCPGLGFQGADIDKTSAMLLENSSGAIFPVSRGISGTAEANASCETIEDYVECVSRRYQDLIGANTPSG